MGDPVSKEVLRFYEERDRPPLTPSGNSDSLPAFEYFPGNPNYNESIQNYAKRKYRISGEQLQTDKKVRDAIDLEMYMEAYA